MIDRKEFKKMAKKILKSNNRAVNIKLMHPAREWWTGLFTGFIILFLAIAWSSSTYLSYRQTGSVDGGSVDGEVIVYREVLVKAALEAYEEKSLRYQSLIGDNNIEPTVITESQTSVSPLDDESGTTTESENLDIESESTSEEINKVEDSSGEVIDTVELDEGSLEVNEDQPSEEGVSEPVQVN